ncbi:2'-5' RNA ligase family protein [Mariniflexile soesokkakense]|uniref:2'-5' RNA ligase family protein n=1 Tax=Mariniflexile soesokkakense TaxID=1343160 RepID=A0ABV0AEY8_9FLAO
MSEIKIYNLRIVPPNPLYTEVNNFKSIFIDTFGKQPLSKSKPHITLAVFEMDVHYQEFLIKAFNQLSSIKQFKLNIQEFDIFDTSNVLVLKVPSTETIEYLQTQIKILWIRELHRKHSSLIIPTTPYITISKTNSKKMLYDSLDFFRRIDIPNKQIDVNHLVLVSRHKGRTWDWKHDIKLS